MSAYVLVEIEILDPSGYEEYKKLTPASIAAYVGALWLEAHKQNR